jgi:chromosome segregation ATPase
MDQKLEEIAQQQLTVENLIEQTQKEWTQMDGTDAESKRRRKELEEKLKSLQNTRDGFINKVLEINQADVTTPSNLVEE